MNTKRHYIITTLGSYGDILPFITLAESIKALGHEVTFVSNPYFKKDVTDKNIHFFALGSKDDFLRITLSDFRVDKGSVTFLKELVFDHLGALNQFIFEQKKVNKKIIVICNFVTLLNAKAIRELNEGIQIISAHLSPWSFYSLYDNDKLMAYSPYQSMALKDKENLWNIFSKKYRDILPGLNEAREKLNLAPITNLHQYLTKQDQFHLTLFPKWFAKKNLDWPSNIIYGDFIYNKAQTTNKISQQLNEFIKSGDKPILISHPTLQERYARTQETYLYRLINHVTKKNKYRFIFSSPDLENITSDNPAIFHSGVLNHDHVLPEMKLLIHHGGVGTIAQALKWGIPQVMYGNDLDQIYNARLVEKLGAGILMKESQPTEYEFLTYIEKLILEGTIKNQCVSIKEKFMDALSPIQIADMINKSL